MNQMNPRFRDLSVVPTSPTTALVIACDSSAGIGEKPLDAVQIDSAITAAYSLRVPLLELLCFGARPIAVVDTVGNEMVPTGRRVIQGLKRELTKAGFYDIPLNGSTEDNMPTRTTAIGVTVIGQINRKDIPTTSIDDSLIVYQLGTPYVGEAVKAHLATIFSYDQVRTIRATPAVVDMLPVGSKGIANELAQMAATHTAKISAVVDLADSEFTQSAGPATVLLVAVVADKRQLFETQFPELTEIAQLHQNSD